MTHPDQLARQLTLDGVAPNVAAGWSYRGPEGWRSEAGGEVQTLFDLASLTKPMTAVAVASARLPATTPLAALVPELADTASAHAPLELLLAHRAGLVAHIPIFAPLAYGGTVDLEAALRTAANGRRDDAQGNYPPGGFAPVYSDLGYTLAGQMLARHAGTTDAGEAIDRHVVAPLALGRELGTARDLELRGIAVQTLAAPTELVPWRGGLVRGRVHDENAWALTGDGGSGHAGMFGTIRAVLRFGEAVLDALAGSGPFASVDLTWLVGPRPGGTLRAGFDGKSPVGSSAGERFGPRSFGHLGFTGTSLWIDPDAGVVAALLTNRVSPTRASDAIRRARPLAHDALHAHATSLGTKVGAR